MLDDHIITESQALIIGVFCSFRKELLAAYGNIDFSLKRDHSQVTELDLKLESYLQKELARAYPQLGFAGEETGSHVRNGQPYWLIDPIDGTSSFVRGLPNCTNMAALIVDGLPVAAVIYDFVIDKLYTARRGHGAFCDGKRLAVRERPINQSAIYIDSFRMPEEYRQPLRDNYVGVYRPFGASGRAYTLLAEGKIDGYSLLDGRASAHDNAPGVLIVEEAGGKIATKSGKVWDIDTKDFVVGTQSVTGFFNDLFRYR